MSSNILRSLVPRSPQSRISIILKPSKATTTSTAIRLARCRRQPLKINSTNSNTNRNDLPPRPPPSSSGLNVTPPETVEIKFKRGARRRRLREDGTGDGQPLSIKAPEPTPKKWEDMSLAEKTMELYVGEKGLLFWLNKFAYASIFFVIGGWILFRFVGPSLNLYQLDTPPMSPSNMFKGS